MKIQDPFEFSCQKAFSGFFIAAGLLVIAGVLMSMKPAPPPLPLLPPIQLIQPKAEAVVVRPVEAVEVFTQQCVTQERLEEVEDIIGIPQSNSNRSGR